MRNCIYLEKKESDNSSVFDHPDYECFCKKHNCKLLSDKSCKPDKCDTFASESKPINQLEIMKFLSDTIDFNLVKKDSAGFIGGWNSEYIQFVLNNKEYVLTLKEVPEDKHWSDYIC